MPGVAVKDLKVEVLNTPTCVVQWSGGRGNKEQRQCDERSYHHHVAVLSHRVRLGNSVDCEKLSANLSRGILRMTAPIKKHQDEPPQTRSIPITERDD
jgi:HSP20 family molecular chaperone IbpA